MLLIPLFLAACYNTTNHPPDERAQPSQECRFLGLSEEGGESELPCAPAEGEGPGGARPAQGKPFVSPGGAHVAQG
jgi:hypothetical protein